MRRLSNDVPAVIALKDNFLGEFIRKTRRPPLLAFEYD